MASKTFGLLANGPSATAEDAAKLRTIVDELIAINDAYKLCKGADGKYFCDAIYGTDSRWWKWAYPDITRDFDGELITQRVQWTFEPESWGIECYESYHGLDICTEPGKIHTGQNSGFAAINVAFHRGAKTIYLLGYDMSKDGDRRHSVTGRPDNMNVDSNYSAFCKCFATIDAEKHGMRIINLSRRTALNCFPLGDLDECAALSSAPGLASAA